MKIKLRNMTEEQFEKWQNQNCFNPTTNCEKCIFNNVSCDYNAIECWVNNKELYSDKFLNQKVEIEDEPILTDKEKEYLRAVIKPFRDIVVYIKKIETGPNEQFIRIQLKTDSLPLPYFENDKYYKYMEVDREYTLEDLEL